MRGKQRIYYLCGELEALVTQMQELRLENTKKGSALSVLAQLCELHLKSQQNGVSPISELNDLCTRHLMMMHFDSTSILDTCLDESGKIIISEIDHSVASEVANGIINQILDEVMKPSNDEEIVGQETIKKLSKTFESLSVMSLSLRGVSTVFHRTLWSLIDSDSFEPFVFLSFLQEVAIFSELMLKNKGFENFPDIWSIFQDLAIQQVTTFELLMDTKEYAQAHELLWILSNTTDYQKNFLDECVQQTVEFKNLMSELAKSWQTMLDIQEGFIVKLIARLQASKAQQTVSTSQLPNSAEC